MTGRTNSGEYAPGIPHRVDLDQVEPLLRSLWEAAERAPRGRSYAVAQGQNAESGGLCLRA
ncbi:MAG: hypothetical protein KatS3mg057_2835 [Herpetosiphonaceae bacterium]|nr:MAG: hypothetical protein KatS3mg057_2835 [Herpetosiphonaceae bacterium]